MCVIKDTCSAEICMFYKNKTVIVGPQCIPRKIYSIATEGSLSELFVAVEGTDPWSATCLVLTENIHSICISCQGRVNDGVF